MVIRWIKSIEKRLREAAASSDTRLTRGQKFLWFCIDLGRHARKELRDDSAPTMAAALTYRTIFGLVPMIVMALIVFRAFGGFSDSQENLSERVYDLLGVETVDTQAEIAKLVKEAEARAQAKTKAKADSEAKDRENAGAQDDTGPPPSTEDPDDPVPPTPGTDPATPPLTDGSPKQPGADAEPANTKPWWWARQFNRKTLPSEDDPNKLADPELEEARTRLLANAKMREQIDKLLQGLAEGAASIKIGSIGVIGMLLLIWAGLGLIVTVERTFNNVFNAPSGRRWHVRIPIYWAVITLGPVLIWGSFYLTSQVIEGTEDIVFLGPIIGLLKQFTALIATWLLFLLLFKLMPNAEVALRPAMIGALVSALAWEVMKAALRWYIEGAVISPTHSRLYGSLALIPIMLFWVYLTWLVVLAGLEVTYILQTMPKNRVGHFESDRNPPVGRDPWLVIPVMSAVSEAFDRGETIGVDQIAEAVKAPAENVADLADALVKRGLLHKLVEDDGGTALALAMPPGRIRIADLIASDIDHPDGQTMPGHDLLKQLAKAQDAALADVTLATKKPSPEDQGGQPD